MGVQKGSPLFPFMISLFSGSMAAVSSQEPSRDALLWLRGGTLNILWKVSHRSEVENLSATAITPILSPGGQGKCVLSNSPEDYQGGKDC